MIQAIVFLAVTIVIAAAVAIAVVRSGIHHTVQQNKIARLARIRQWLRIAYGDEKLGEGIRVGWADDHLDAVRYAVYAPSVHYGMLASVSYEPFLTYPPNQ